MLRADEVVLEGAGLVLGENDDLASPFQNRLEQPLDPPSGSDSGGRSTLRVEGLRPSYRTAGASQKRARLYLAIYLGEGDQVGEDVLDHEVDAAWKTSIRAFATPRKVSR